MKPNIQRVVVCAANKSKITGRVICGARHWDSIMRQHCIQDGKMAGEWVNAYQGFIDQHGVWMDRQEAYRVAKSAGQVKFGDATADESTLYSEDIY